MAFLNGSVEVKEVVAIFSVMATDEILMKVLVEERIKETKFTFIQMIFSFLALLVFFKECLFRFMEIEEEAIYNFEGLIGGLGVRKSLIEQIIDDFPQGFVLGREHLHHLMEIGHQEEGIGVGVEEQLHVHITEGINGQILPRKEKDSWEVVDEIIYDFLVFAVGNFHKGLPEFDALGFILHDYFLQFLECLAHEGCNHKNNFLVLGCQRIYKQFYYSAALFLQAEFSCVSENYFQGH